MKLLSNDIETLYEDFLVKVKVYDDYPTSKEGKWYTFAVNKWQNDLFALAKFFETHADYYWIGFNNVNFDSQVMEWVLRTMQRWVDLDNLEITARIWQKAQDIISDIKNGIFPPYREDSIRVKLIDIFKIHHFDNEAKRTSLKWLEFMMDMENIEDMPLHHKATGMRVGDIQEIDDYCINDVLSTERGYDYTIGNVESEEYKGKNKVQDRLDLMTEFEFPYICMNWSDVKIGDELNKMGYCQLTGKTPKDIYELKKKRGPTKKFTFGDCIPPYVEFQTAEFNAFFNKVKKIKVSLIDGDKQEQPFTYKGTTYTIAKGGIHSTEKNRIIIPGPNEILRDADVGSQYPNAIVKRGLFPSHLGKEWLVNYKATIERRIEFKKKGKDDTKYKGLAEMLKLALNGGGFGMTNLNTNWQYDPRVTFFCTIGNQFEILMLIEQMELNGIHCVSANTDGIVCLFTKDKEQKYNETCKWWEQKVGNTEMGVLEFMDFEKLVQEHVNSYIALKKDDPKPKVKGRFLVDGWLNKNNTDKIGRIERKALVEYFTKNVPIETTILNESNIFMFCIGVKSSKNYSFKTLDYKTGEVVEEYNRITRFIVTKEGSRLVKMKRPGSEAPGAALTKVVDGWKVTVVNNLPKRDYTKRFQSLDYQYYINNAQKLADSIEKGKKKKKAKETPFNKNQVNLF